MIRMTGRMLSIKRMAVHDGEGIRTTLFLKGCPLRCRWCHNPEGIARKPQTAYYPQKCLHCGGCAGLCQANRMAEGRHQFWREKCISCGRCAALCPGEAFAFYGRETTVEEILPQLLEDRIFYESSGGGVTLSGGEPLLQIDFAEALLRQLKEAGVHTAVDTCGCVPWSAFERALPYTDVFLFDVKAVDSDVHRALTGQPNELILENLRALAGAGAALEIRVPCIPGMNDGELAGIARLLARLPVGRVKLLPYHHFAASKYAALGMPYGMPDMPSPDSATMDRWVAMFQAQGVPAAR